MNLFCLAKVLKYFAVRIYKILNICPKVFNCIRNEILRWNSLVNVTILLETRNLEVLQRKLSIGTLVFCVVFKTRQFVL